ncbi:MAG: hypothetical protein L6R42_009558, partial [Xanthoria sp. 1 TBL-2021]
GNPHEVYEFEDEKEFLEKGDVARQREEFVGKEGRRLLEVEGVDRGVEKGKRRERREKRKRRERVEMGGVEGEEVRVELVPFEGPEEDGGGDEVGDAVESRKSNGLDEERVERKRKRKHSGDDELLGSNKLEDLEAMASGLLA